MQYLSSIIHKKEKISWQRYKVLSDIEDINNLEYKMQILKLLLLFFFFIGTFILVLDKKLRYIRWVRYPVRYFFWFMMPFLLTIVLYALLEQL